MKKSGLLASIGAICITLVSLVACDWSSGSENNFNSSGSSGITNISGFYEGNFSSGRVVATTSGGNIVHLTIQQSGNRIQVTDNQGSSYEGSVGSPATQSHDPDNIPAGANIATYQISFEGKDGVSGRDVRFTGTISLVATAIIEGRVSGDGAVFDSVSAGTTVTNSPSGSTTVTNGNATQGTITGVTYVIAEQSTQLRLQGTWIEVGGQVSSVDGVAAGLNGSVVTAFPSTTIPSVSTSASDVSTP